MTQMRLKCLLDLAIFCDKYNVSVGYLGSYYDGTSVHGGAIKFGIEF